MKSRADYRELIRAGGFRATAPRLAVLHVLERSARPLTHGEVAEALSDAGYDRATLYRNLMDLTEIGLLNRTDYGDHMWRFEWVGSEEHVSDGHAHFICKSCGTVECLPVDAVAINSTRKSPKAMRRRELQVELRGLCDACA